MVEIDRTTRKERENVLLDLKLASRKRATQNAILHVVYDLDC